MIGIEESRQGNWIIVLSFIMAIMLTALPLPEWAVNWRPSWVAIVLIYWCMAVPDRVGILVAWFFRLITGCTTKYSIRAKRFGPDLDRIFHY